MHASKHILYMGLILFAVLIIGCSPAPTPLKKAASRLTPGMSRSSVIALFAEFESPQGKDEEAEIPMETVLFQTNVLRAIEVSYWPRTSKTILPLWEVCYVYFDTNDIIVGYKYTKD